MEQFGAHTSTALIAKARAAGILGGWPSPPVGPRSMPRSHRTTSLFRAMTSYNGAMSGSSFSPRKAMSGPFQQLLKSRHPLKDRLHAGPADDVRSSCDLVTCRPSAPRGGSAAGQRIQLPVLHRNPFPLPRGPRRARLRGGGVRPVRDGPSVVRRRDPVCTGPPYQRKLLPYTTRVLLRRPGVATADSTAWVSILNASQGYDIEDDWRRAWDDVIIGRGDTYVAVTAKPINADALQVFDPVRYDSVKWPGGEAAPAASRTRLEPLPGDRRQPGGPGVGDPRADRPLAPSPAPICRFLRSW